MTLDPSNMSDAYTRTEPDNDEEGYGHHPSEDLISPEAARGMPSDATVISKSGDAKSDNPPSLSEAVKDGLTKGLRYSLLFDKAQVFKEQFPDLQSEDSEFPNEPRVTLDGISGTYENPVDDDKEGDFRFTFQDQETGESVVMSFGTNGSSCVHWINPETKTQGGWGIRQDKLVFGQHECKLTEPDSEPEPEPESGERVD